MFRVLRFLFGSTRVSFGLLVSLGFFLGQFLALASTQCNCVVPFWVFLIYTFLLIKKSSLIYTFLLV